MGPSPPKTSPFTGTPYPATETPVQPCCITKNPLNLPQLTRTFSNQGSPSPPCYPPNFGVIPPPLHEGPLRERGVDLGYSLPVYPSTPRGSCCSILF